MTKKIICLAVLLIMLFSLSACGNSQGKFDELQNKIDKQGDRITELENENELKDGKIADLENDLQIIKEQIIKDDFVLTISVNSSFVTNGQTITVNAALKNQSGKSYTILYSGYGLIRWFIPEWKPEFEYPEELAEPAPPERLSRFEKDTSIYQSFSILVEDQEPGVYELHFSSAFSYLDLSDTENLSESEIDWDKAEGMFIYSDKIAIIVQ